MRKVIFIISVVLAASCSREYSNEFYPYPNNELNDTNWYGNVPSAAKVRQLDSVLVLPEIVDSISLAGGVLELGDSIKITFPPSFCTGSGIPAGSTPMIKVSVTILDTKGAMIRADKPTMSYEKLLVTGGAVHIIATYNGSPVQMAPGKSIKLNIITRMSNTSPSDDMKVFYGKEDAYPATAVQPFTWIPSQDSLTSGVNRFQDSATGLKGYEFFSTRFGWVNCDYFADTTLARTKASVTLPVNFTNANTNVYAVVKSPDIVAQLFPDQASKSFIIPNIYVGKVVTFVSLSYIQDKLYLGVQEVTITPNMTISLHPAEKTKSEVLQYLSNL